MSRVCAPQNKSGTAHLLPLSSTSPVTRPITSWPFSHHPPARVDQPPLNKPFLSPTRSCTQFSYTTPAFLLHVNRVEEEGKSEIWEHPKVGSSSSKFYCSGIQRCNTKFRSSRLTAQRHNFSLEFARQDHRNLTSIQIIQADRIIHPKMSARTETRS